MADIVWNREVNPWGNVDRCEASCRRQAGAAFAGQNCSVTDIGRKRCYYSGDHHRTLQKLITIVAHAYELSKLHAGDPIHVRALLGAVFKASLKAANMKGNWSQNWPLLRIADPDEKTQISVTSPVERVAMAALQKDKGAPGKRHAKRR